MFSKCVSICLIVVSVTVSARTVSPSADDNNVIPQDTFRGFGASSVLDELRYAYNVYKNCDGEFSCLKLKFVGFFDRASRSVSDLSFMGLSFVKDPNSPDLPALKSESELEADLPRSLEERDDRLNGLILDKIGSFFSSHSLQIKLPTASDLQRAFSDDEGRAKKKKQLGGLLTLPLILGATLIPVVLGGLALLAGKALLTAKVALLLAGIIAFKKLFGGGSSGALHSHDSHHDVVVPSAHVGTGWGRSWDKNTAQKMAYSAYAPNSTEK